MHLGGDVRTLFGAITEEAAIARTRVAVILVGRASLSPSLMLHLFWHLTKWQAAAEKHDEGSHIARL